MVLGDMMAIKIDYIHCIEGCPMWPSLTSTAGAWASMILMFIQRT